MYNCQRLFTEPPSLAEFERLCSQTTKPESYPLAGSIEHNVPIYNLQEFHDQSSDQETVASLQDEWYHVLLKGPGVFVLKGMYTSSTEKDDKYSSALSSTTKAYKRIIHHEHSTKASSGGDHFANKGANDRIWNSFSKHALADPESFGTYYSNPWLSHVSTAWLGPSYRITAQVNIVKPGGAAQNPHRDYHLGFQGDATCRQYPRSMHMASAFLTLQGAVAHTDMPLASGPTWLLPFSQQFADGYLAWRRDEFKDYFATHHVSLPLERGDGIFFNPALFHAAGANRTADFDRIANLFQISSAFGKAMESVDPVPVVARCWDVLTRMYQAQAHAHPHRSSDSDSDSVHELQEGQAQTTEDKDKEPSVELMSLIRAIADGYPFPLNLDRRPPAPTGLAPESEQDLLVRALKAGWARERVIAELKQMRIDAMDEVALSLQDNQH